MSGIGICGAGIVSGYGSGTDAFWNGLCSGLPAARQVGGYGPGRDQSAWIARVEQPSPDRSTRYQWAFTAAAGEAIADARSRGWDPGDGERVALIHAAVLGDADTHARFYTTAWAKDARPIRDTLALMQSTILSAFARDHRIRGPVVTVSANCTSSLAGLDLARLLLAAGDADHALIVATDLSANPEITARFVDLGVAVHDEPPLVACRPFQQGSRGFGMGEASAALVLSSRSDRPYARLLATAQTHDAHHPTSVNPDSLQPTRCVRNALAAAKAAGSEVTHFHAHGPGTQQCDRAETAVHDALFPQAAIYSIKPLAGHCHAAAGAAELIASALAYEHGVIPAPPAVADRHPKLLSGRAPASPGITVKTSLGLGGYNAAAVLAPV